MKKEESWGSIIKSGLLRAVIIVVGLWAVFSFINTMSDQYEKEDEETNKIMDKKAACDTLTDAYHKCTYSVWEERCVCKER